MLAAEDVREGVCLTAPLHVHSPRTWDGWAARGRADLLGQLGRLLAHVLARSCVHGLIRYREGRAPKPWELPGDDLLGAMPDMALFLAPGPAFREAGFDHAQPRHEDGRWKDTGKGHADGGAGSSGTGKAFRGSGHDTLAGGAGADILDGTPKSGPKPKAWEEGIDVDRALEYLKKIVGGRTESLRKCARYVRLAIHHGGEFRGSHPEHAKDYGPYLEQNGYEKVNKNSYRPQKGDIVVLQSPGPKSPSGHITIYDGERWISDHVQRDMFSGPGYRQKAKEYPEFYQIYRKK